MPIKNGGIEASLIIETYTYSEDPDIQLLRETLRAANRIRQENPAQCEVLLADISGNSEVLALLKEFPEVRRIDAAGLEYDGSKLLAAQQAQGEYLLFLDGDCLPQPGWFDYQLTALRSGKTDATGGFSRYRGGFFAAVNSVLDFGFMFPLKRRALACYASNNAGFRRSTFLACPIPVGLLRCNCYAHAQLLMRRANGVVLIPEARVLHKREPFFVERIPSGTGRRGGMPCESLIAGAVMAESRSICRATVLYGGRDSGLDADGSRVSRSRYSAPEPARGNAFISAVSSGGFRGHGGGAGWLA